MLFNSHVFILVFLPLVAFGFWVTNRVGARARRAWLVLVSVFFYGWWYPPHVLLLLASILANFALGGRLGRQPSGWLLALGVTLNLGLLGYFKYAGFMAENLRWLTGWAPALGTVVLPLAISFFTFQQIAYLVDVWRGEAVDYDLVDYALFVTFFPQLIAGPIVHHAEMMPQFWDDALGRSDRGQDLAVAAVIFFFGLFKKVILADSVGAWVGPVYDGAAAGQHLTGWEAWGGTLAFAFQVYFDFSGYSDMAIGSARLFGIRLPLNFDSPYKATSIDDFWRRWHMTLTRLVLDYLYTPLALRLARAAVELDLTPSARFPLATALPLALAFIAVGVWHGAGWTFLLFGALHGGYMVLNALWREFRRRRRRRLGLGGQAPSPGPALRWLCRVATFLAVVFSLALFRAKDLSAVGRLYEAMLGLHGFPLPQRYELMLGPVARALARLGVTFAPVPLLKLKAVAVLPVLLAIVWLAPNTQQILARHSPALGVVPSDGEPRWWEWRPTWYWALVVGAIAALALLGLTSVDRFIYFQF
ncbi:MAG: MBOAT family protein [Planctomycetota bacterium]